MDRNYVVIVGNIGTVYSGSSRAEAMADYSEYTDRSIAGIGRGAGESVILFFDDDIELEHFGENDQVSD